MEALRVEYGSINGLGMVFIPCCMQQQSNFKACENGIKIFVSYSVDENYIVGSFEETVNVKKQSKTCTYDFFTIDAGVNNTNHMATNNEEVGNILIESITVSTIL